MGLDKMQFFLQLSEESSFLSTQLEQKGDAYGFSILNQSFSSILIHIMNVAFPGAS